MKKRVTLERTFAAPIEDVWELWTTKDGIESWWGPEGFRVEVRKLDLRVGGELLYAMIAAGSEQIAFMQKAGMPRITEHRNGFTDVTPLRRLAYTSVTDFIPGVAPYEVETVVELEQTKPGVKMMITFDAMHDAHWTEMATLGWSSELDKLGKVLAANQETRRKPMKKITPFLWFDGQAEQAMKFYTSIFPNSKELSVSRYGEGGLGPAGSVMTASFVLNGEEFVALNGGPQFKFTPAVSFLVNCETQEEVDRYWDRLGAGGREDPCGWLQDKFGLSWQIIPTLLPQLLQDKDKARAGRVMTAMMKMTKIDMKALKEAAEGK
jgi:predicted 3-demethylubiquinone-9 3-methyltransferase (glyoxalase superfamily)